MKRLTALLLALLLLAIAIPASAADEDFVLEIKGGPVSEHTETVDGTDCLKVEVLLHGASAAKKLSALYFELCYDGAQMTAVQYKTNPTATGTVSLQTANKVRFGYATGSGVAFTDGGTLLTIWFALADDLKAGTEINFTLGAAEVEALVSGTATPCTLGSDFTPFTVDAPTPTATPTPTPTPTPTATATASPTATPTAEPSASPSTTPLIGLEGTVEWNAEDVKFKGETAYVIYDGKAHEPRFTVRDADENVIDPQYYDFEYCENTKAGTGYVLVTFTNGYAGTCRGSFKIYLPATTQTAVENIEAGIKVTWAPVDGAAGYVIYRRAWSSTTNGWTAFARWNNTTATTYIDGADDAHKVYAGTRYQYGIKAYFARRLDPIANIEIGGNVNDPSGNYNLGEVGPLKTTVRITTRKLNSVTPGSKQLTVKWTPSAVFTGYQIQAATNTAFTQNVKTVKIADAKTAQTTVRSLKSNTTYYVRVRSYHEFNGMTYYGGWSNVMNAKTK